MNLNENWQKISTLIFEYLQENQDPKTPVINYVPAKELEQIANLKLGHADTKLIQHIEQYLKYSVRTSHPQYNNQLWAGFNSLTYLGEMIANLTNTSMATYEIAPMATLMERELVQKLGHAIGYELTEGIMVTGGSMANMQAIHCARQKFFPETREKGTAKDLHIYISDQAHYSFLKAINLMGMGTENLIKVKSQNAKMIPSELEKEIQKSKAQNKVPFFVCSTVGTTVMGAFDPVIEIDKIAKQHKLWHHLDGAWGGSVLLSKKYKHLIEGSQLADSFTWDAHKMLGSTLMCSFFLTKHKDALIEANSGGGKKYIFHEYENADYDTGPYSLQCGRRNDAFKFWLTWKVLGDEGLEQQINKLFENAKFVRDYVNSHPRLKLIGEPESLNVCYQVLPEDDRNVNEYNYSLRYKMMKQGKFYVNISRNENQLFFRHTLANNQTTPKSLKVYFESLLAL
jgi:glutamate/tyrosine decarboxylase-like PLP-dependent enzyme